MSRRKRILFMAEGITMTHFVRPAALAESLDPEEFEVYFWTPKRYHRHLSQSFSRLGDLWTLEPADFLKALARGSTLYSAELLTRYVNDDLRIIREVRPDLMVGDFRLSLSISAVLAKVPFASIFNAQWSPFRTQPAIAPELPLTRYVSPRLVNLLFGAVRPAVFALHAKPINDVRRAFGLPRLSNDLREIYTTGDLTLYPDIPEFVPLDELPRHHHYIGVCPFSVNATRPKWWDEVMSARAPKIFVSLGSSGPVKAMPAVIEAASQLPVKTIVSTSGRDVGKLGPNVYVADLLPYEETARQCAFVISHGGTGALYPALSAGAPMLAIPSNIDNHLSTDLLVRSGAGLSVRVEWASVRNLRRVMLRLLDEPRFKISAAQWSSRIASYDTRMIFPEILRRWFGIKPQLVRVPTALKQPVLV